jgi:hypothetical protein
MADIILDFGFKDLEKANKVLKELKKAANDLRKTIQGTGTALEGDAAKAKKLASSAKLVAAEKKKLNTVDREQIKIAKQLDTINAKIALANSKEARTLAAKKKQLQAINRQLRTGGKNTASWGKALGSFQFKFNALGNIAANVMSTMTRAIRRGITDSIKIIADFDQAMADVKAITGATGEEFDKLSKSARALGGSTKFTASQVAQLQKEYSKLGFTTKEILKVQSATLDLAAATGTDLARAAEVTGITLRQFGLDAEETQRVVDVMARSFTSSALDMEKFAEAMKFVGPAAKASGISIERATALLGQLADAGISGSMAGTSLRQIMLALSKESGTLAEKIERAAEKGLTLAGASEEVQKRAATAFLVLADGVDTLDDFTEALEDAGGAAQEMADVQLDTLRGKADLVKSAWQGMVLAIANTEDGMEGAKSAMGGLVTLLNAIALSAETGGPLGAALHIEKITQQAIEETLAELEKAPLTMEQIQEQGKGVLNTFKQFGINIWKQIFPKEDAPVQELEDISDIIKGLGELDGLQEDGGLEPWMSAEDLDVLNEIYRLSEGDYMVYLENLNNLADESTAESLEIFEQAEADKLAVAQQTLSRIGALNSALTSRIVAQKNRELSAVANNDKERAKIEEKYFQRQQDAAIATAIINGALGITNVWATWAAFPPVAIALSALEAAVVGVEIAAIKNQKFAEGGPVTGESHSRGGVNIEAEGGEYVINKRSTAKYKDLIKAINEDDQVRIMDAMSRDRKIELKTGTDPYTKKMFELMEGQVSSWEDKEFWYNKRGNTTLRMRKN